MRSFQDIIEEQLKIVKERGEIITPDEFHMICEAEQYRPPGEKWYSKHRSLVGPGEKIKAGALTVLSLGLYGIYRRMTDKCTQRCKGMTGSRGAKCAALCNMNGAKHVLDYMKSKQGTFNSIKDPVKRQKAMADFQKEYEKWQDRYEKYKDRTQAASLTVAQMKYKDD